MMRSNRWSRRRYTVRVLNWTQATDRIAAASPSSLQLEQRRYAGLARIPVIITGNSGAGKTRLWSALTGKKFVDSSSRNTDDGYLFQAHRTPIALVTVPGQDSLPRFSTLRQVFGPGSRLDGVIFVASFGYDHLWPGRPANSAAAGLASITEQELLEWNRRLERDAFREICTRISEMSAFRSPPHWLLVVVNKVDLYWNRIGDAAQYYMPGGKTEFDKIATDLLVGVGMNNLKYDIVPCATSPGNYAFDSARGRISTASQLDKTQCSAAVRCVIDKLEELAQ